MERGEASFSAQLRRGVIEYCALAIIDAGPTYGLDIARQLGDAGLLESEGTLYPLLSRLRRRELVVTTWQESKSGPPRRYYELTADGRATLNTWGHEWRTFQAGVDALVGAPR